MPQFLRAAGALALLSLLVAPSTAQTILYRSGVPDLDQRRDPLPGNGGMYCAPTASVNYMAYLADRGFPNLMAGQLGPWQTSTNPRYERVTTQIATMGVLMNTDAEEGTRGGLGPGLQTYLNIFEPGKFVVWSRYGEVNVGWLWFHMVQGHLVLFAYGKYQEGGGTWWRVGGHVVTLTALRINPDGTGRLTWRDPNSDDSINAQSTFTSKLSQTSRQSISIGYASTHRWRLWDVAPDSPNRRYMDSMHAIQPLVALSAPSGSGLGVATPSLAIVRPVEWPYATDPDFELMPMPAGTSMVDVALHPDGRHAACVTSQLSPRAQYVYLADLATREVRLLTSFSQGPVMVDYDRFGRLIVSGAGLLRFYEIDQEDSYTLVGSIPTVGTADALQFDDRRNEVVCLTRSTGMLTRYPVDGGDPTQFPLPEEVALGASPSLAVDPATTRYFVGSEGSSFIHALRPMGIAFQQLVLEQTIPSGVSTPVQGLTIGDDGTLVISSGGAVRQLERSMGPSGQPIWTPVADSQYTGYAISGPILVSRSRSNQSDAELAEPGWADVPDDTEVAPEVVDCSADLVEPFGVLNFSTCRSS